MKTALCGRLSILVADDDEMMRRFIARRLSTQDVRTMKDLAEVKAALAAGYRPDVVLTDYHLNGDTGQDVVNAVKRVAPSACCFVMTSDPEAARRAGCMNVIEKMTPAFEELLKRLATGQIG
jgi:DNA-binding NtrC family response regulator